MCEIGLKHLGVEVSTAILHGHVHAASSINVPLATETVDQYMTARYPPHTNIGIHEAWKPIVGTYTGGYILHLW